MNLISILNLIEGLGTQKFKENFKIGHLDHFKEISWIGGWSHPQLHDIFGRISDNENTTTKTLEGSTISAEDEKVLLEFGTKQASQKFRAGGFMNAYLLSDRPIVQSFGVTGADNLCLLLVLNSGGYIQRQVVTVHRKDNSLYVVKLPHVFQVLLRLYFVNLVRSEIKWKHVSVRINYQIEPSLGLRCKGQLRHRPLL